jgi:large subunit ribosomal protein L10
MAKTKTQKVEAVKSGVEELKKSQTVIIADFTGVPVNDINTLRKTLIGMGAAFTVVKKRLLKIVFEKEGMEFDPKKFAGQTGVVFSPKDIVETAGAVYQFAKTKKDKFKILGGFEVKEKKFIDGADVKRIGQLPGREVLLGQLVGMLVTPIRQLLYVLDQQSKKTVEAK